MTIPIEITAIRIVNLVVSTNPQGFRSITPFSRFARQGRNHLNIPYVTYGNRVEDNAMAFRILNGEITFNEALNRGTVVEPMNL
jgi:hypothetical protein